MINKSCNYKFMIRLLKERRGKSHKGMLPIKTEGGFFPAEGIRPKRAIFVAPFFSTCKLLHRDGIESFYFRKTEDFFSFLSP